MANIYLRISRYISAAVRATGDGGSRPLFEPVEFSPYTQEYVILTNGLRIISERQQHWAWCYSQQAWQNMLKGKPPHGGSQLLTRKADNYLSVSEVCALEAVRYTNKMGAFDFLCIAVPRTIISNGKMERVSKSHTLDATAAQQLRRLLYNQFVRLYLDFETRNRLFAESKGIQRSIVEIVERFLMEYDIPVSHDNKERDTLRRLAQRWRKDAQLLATSPVIVGDKNITRMDEYELRGEPFDSDD